MRTALDPVEQMVRANGCQIAYREVGSGEPVVCLHGGGPGASGWSNFAVTAPTLSEHFRLLIPDFPGFGRSTTPGPVASPLEFFADTLNAFLAELGIDRAHFVGNSTGGGVSAKVAIDHPERVNRLVLMGSAGYGVSHFSPIPNEGLRLIFDYYPDPTRDKMRKLLEAFVYDSQFPGFEDLLEARYQASLDPAVRKAFVERGPHISLTHDLPKITARTLLIWGREDRFVMLDHALGFLSGIPDARLIVFNRCGHWVQAEKRDEFNRCVIDFLRADEFGGAFS